LICPLRERTEDIPILVDHFIEKFARQAQRPLEGIEPEALDALFNYRWPETSGSWNTPSSGPYTSVRKSASVSKTFRLRS
jgi:hypothetical protein